MGLKVKQPDYDELCLAIIMQDPVLFSEFMRNTKDGSMQKDLWPKKEFKYRHYQRDLLTDKNHYISLIGGRSIGKCMSGKDKVYTSRGYKNHNALINKKFLVWAFDGKDLVLRRGYVAPDGVKAIWEIETASGNTIHCTKLHPILTQNGYKLAEDIKIGDLAAVITRLPHTQTATYAWHDVRLLGYLYGQISSIQVHNQWIPLKSKQALEEMQIIASKMDMRCHTNSNGEFKFWWKPREKQQHPLYRLFSYFDLHYLRKYNAFNHIPERITELNEENLKVFLEAYLSQYAELTPRNFSIKLGTDKQAEQIKELLLRFGIETKIVDTPETEIIDKRRWGFSKKHVALVNRDYRAVYRLWKTFNIPGYTVGNLKVPEQSFDATDFYRFEPIVRKDYKTRRRVYALQVENLHNYISEDILVHNSLVLEDRLLFQLYNNQKEMTEVPEIVLTTANQAQMTPVLDKLNRRVLSSPLFKHFSRGLNNQKGTMDFNFKGRDVRLYTRIAGSKAENSVVGLHLTYAYIDEAQIYPLSTYTQLTPTINMWQDQYGIISAGVPNGLTNTTLYRLDQRDSKFKKYRIPAPQNPFYSYRDYIQALKDYGGEEDDRFLNLVLGEHGTGSEQVITRDQMKIEPYDFYTLRYSTEDKLKGAHYLTHLHLPVLNDYTMLVAGIDTGFVDPTIIQVFGLKNSRWYTALRIKLQRIEYPEQEAIIHWLHRTYGFSKIAIDIGAGGSGATILQSLIMRDEYKSFKYEKILQGVQFSEGIVIGYTTDNKEIKQDTKTVAAQELVRFLQGKQIVLSEIDNEGISELERITKQKSLMGTDRYFILSEKGSGTSRNDHIFASYLCFTMVIRDNTLFTKKKRLGKAIA